MLQELPNKQLIIEKLLSDIPSNSNTAKHLSRNQKQKVQEESVKAIETKKKKNAENKLFLGDSMVNGYMNMAYQKIKVVKYKCFQDTRQKMLDIVKRATSRKPESITNNIT